MARKSNVDKIDKNGVYHGTTKLSAAQAADGQERTVTVTFTPRPKFKGETDQDYVYYMSGAVAAANGRAVAPLKKGGEGRAIAKLVKAAGITSVEQARALLAKHNIATS